MAFKPRREHAFKRIEKDLKQGRIPNVILLCGPEKYLVKFYEERLTKAYVNEATQALDLTYINNDNISTDLIIESCETLSIMSERKVVIVSDFMPADGKSIRGFGDNQIDRLTEYLKNVPETTLLIFTSGELDKRKKSTKFRTAIDKSGAVYDFQPLDDSMLCGFIEKRLKATGKYYKPSVVRALMTDTGYGNKYIEYSLYDLDNDMKKLAAYAGSEITIDDVRAVITLNPENNIFGLIDAVAQNKKGDALVMVHHLFNAKVNPFQIQSMIVNQLETILYSKELSEKGAPLNEICKLINDVNRNAREFQVKKALSLSKKYSYRQLKHMLIGSYEIDRNVKTGIFEPEIAVEYFISSM